MILPSAALNREFVVDEDALSGASFTRQVTSITTHAVLVGDIIGEGLAQEATVSSELPRPAGRWNN